MKRPKSLLAVAGVVATLAAWAGPAAAGPPPGTGSPWQGGGSAVFVQTNDPSGNQIVAYQRDGQGGLQFAGRTDTGGNGTLISGAVVDPLASQGSLAYDPPEHELVAVNGGSDTITVFRVAGTRLFDRRTVPSGGTTPVSVAADGDHIYVLNAGGTGTVQGFDADSLNPIPDTTRDLGLTAALTYLTSPGQIGITPDGRHLVVTTKANASTIDVFGLWPSGALSDSPVVNPSATPVPFSFTFDPAGDLVVTEAGTSNLTTYAVGPSGTLSELGTISDGQSALCWVASAGRYFYGANAGSGTVTTFTVGGGGQPAVVGETTTDPGPIDVAVSPDDHVLYVETGARDIVDEFAIGGNGSLSPIGSVTPELPGHSGLEGIAVS